MSNKRGTRRVFRPPGRFDDSDDDDDQGAQARRLSPKPPRATPTKWKVESYSPHASLAEEDGANQMDALLSGAVSSLDTSLPGGSSNITKEQLQDMDALLSGASASVPSLNSSAKEAMNDSGNFTTPLKVDPKPDDSAQIDSMPIIDKLRKKSQEKMIQQAEVEAKTGIPDEASFDLLLNGASPNTAFGPKGTGVGNEPINQESTLVKISSITSISSTSSKSKKKKKDKDKKKKKKQIEWSNEISVVTSSEPPTRDMESNMEAMESTDSLSELPTLRSSFNRRDSLTKRKSMRIDNKEKLNARWEWTQTLLSTQFMPFKRMLAEGDELLPNPDEHDSFQDFAENEHFERVRDAMLEADDLNEREIAAFIEGIALFSVKVNSLQSQLDSVKAIQRAEDQEVFSRRQSMARSPSILHTLNTPFPRTKPTVPVEDRDGPVEDDKRAMLRSKGSLVKGRSDTYLSSKPEARSSFQQMSRRAMSIKNIQASTKDDKEVQRLLQELEDAEKKQKKLEKQLQQAGVVIAEDIDYDIAKDNVDRIAKRMAEIGSSEVKHEDKEEQTRLRQEYFQLEQEMEKYSTALMLTDEYIEEQEENERKWEEACKEDNLEALKKVRRHMPVDVKSLSEAQLSSDETPNGKFLPKTIAKKFKRTNVLQLIRSNPDDLTKMHPSTLENLRVTGLTLTERRAIYAHLLDVGPRWKAMQGDQMTERKWTWYKMMKSNFKENLEAYDRHVMQYGPPGHHPYATRENPDLGCPLLGKQCPLKADKLIDYDGDYGYTEDAVYEVSSVKKADKEDPGAKAMREAAELTREKKADERGNILKKHYKGKLLQVSLANGSCSTMDATVDNIEFLKRKWIEERLTLDTDVTDDRRRKELTAFSDALNELKLSLLGFAERSGIQLTGRKDVNADQPDIRSPIELGLSEEICETCLDFFEDIGDRMREIKAKDGRLKSTIDQLRELLDELHERNIATLKELGEQRPERSRKLKSSAEITREIKRSLREKAPAVEKEQTRGAAPGPMGGRGGLMDAIAGRGRGPGPTGGRGGLMDAIAGRGRGPGPTGGRGGLMDAIAGRGRGPGPTGGRGGLMDAIAGRGRGPGPTGGRGGLMDAIAGRGRGAAGGRGGGGRGGLLDAIAGRGRGGGRDGGGRGDLT